MEAKQKPPAKPQIQIPYHSSGAAYAMNHMKRSSSSSNSESQTHFDESPHSPLRFHSPLRSDQGDPPDSPPYSSPIASPEKTPSSAVDNSNFDSNSISNSKAIVAVNKATQFSPMPTPSPPPPPPLPPRHPFKEADVVINMAIREEGTGGDVRRVGLERRGTVDNILGRARREERLKVAELGFRLSEVVLCLISFSVMAADKTQGWSGDSFDRYKEYRYCLSVNVIGFVYAGFQAYDLAFNIATGKHVIRHHLRRHFNFFIDQMLAYLLMSSSSSAATRVDDWQTNWGKDDFTVMATASIVMSFLAFSAFAVSSIISGYNLCK